MRVAIDHEWEITADTSRPIDKHGCHPSITADDINRELQRLEDENVRLRKELTAARNEFDSELAAALDAINRL